MDYEIQLPTFECKRCNHIWHPHKPNKPKVCPKCKSPYWDNEYTESGKKALETRRKNK